MPPPPPPPREEDDVNRRLDRKMTDAFTHIWKIHQEKKVPVGGARGVTRGDEG